MHSNYILSPELKERIRAVPSNSEFWKEHACVLNWTENDHVQKWFLSDLENSLLWYDNFLVQRVIWLLHSDKQLPSWWVWVDSTIQAWLFDAAGIPNNNGVFSFSKEVEACLNDIALATAYFLWDVNDSILTYPEKLTPINFRDYDFDTELEFIMSLSAYGISGVKSLNGNPTSRKWLNQDWIEIEIGSADHHDPEIIFRDKNVWKNMSPLGILVDFKPETIDRSFKFSQQTEPEILWSLFSFVAAHRNMHEVFWENGSDLRKLFWYKANEYRSNEDSLRSFTRNAQEPLQVIWSQEKFRPTLEHRLDWCVFVENELWMLEFRRCNGCRLSQKIIFSLSINDAIEMIKSFLFLINKQSTFRTMPRTWYAFINAYFQEL